MDGGVTEAEDIPEATELKNKISETTSGKSDISF